MGRVFDVHIELQAADHDRLETLAVLAIIADTEPIGGHLEFVGAADVVGIPNLNDEQVVVIDGVDGFAMKTFKGHVYLSKSEGPTLGELAVTLRLPSGTDLFTFQNFGTAAVGHFPTPKQGQCLLPEIRH